MSDQLLCNNRFQTMNLSLGGEMTMTNGPVIDRSGLYLGLLSLLPEPVRNFYRAAIPEGFRESVRNLYPYEQDFTRAVMFWANPQERRRRKAELELCRTPDDYFDFATRYLGHQQWRQEITEFLKFAMAEKPVRVCEVGLFTGGTNLMLTHALPTVQLIIGVDMHIRNRSQLTYYAKPSQRQVFVTGKSCDDATLEKVAQALGNEKLDLLFIDADHGYDGVKRDFMCYKQFVREGGVIVFHDIIQDHLTKFKRDPATWEGARSGDVYRFWQNIKPYYENTREFVADYNQDGCGIGALIYSSKVKVPEDL
jgi:predicted O-methyltransferase YrrM